MSTASHEGREIAAPLVSRVGQGADAVQIGDAVFAIWEEIDDALTPILGQRGMAALYDRSLHLAAEAHPWLAAPDESDPPAVGPAALRSALARRSGGVAMAGASAFLQTFRGLLASLVGASLTARLLPPVWSTTSSGPSAQDTMP